MTASQVPSGEPVGGEDMFRRISPAPGPPRRAGVLTVLVRWRIELLLVALTAGLWHLVGGVAVGLLAVAIALSTAVVPGVRRTLIAAVQLVVIPHRVRAGLVQAGVGDRSGRPPWLPCARPISPDGAAVSVWLRAGTTEADLRAAAGVIATACGAAAAEVEQRGTRQDRAVLIIVRPRWGWPGH